MSLENQKKIKRNQYRTTAIKDENIQDLKEKQGWSGEGTPENPIIIDNVKGLKLNLKFKPSDLHYILRGLSLYSVSCDNTQNVTFENCRIYKLELEGCRDMEVRNNAIIGLKLFFTRASVVEGNQLSQETCQRLESNYFERIYPMMIGGMSFVLFTLVFAAFSPLYLGVLGWWVTLISMIAIIMLFFLLRMWQRRKSRTKGLKENLVSNNGLMTDVRAIFSEIVDSYYFLKNSWFMHNLPTIIGGGIGVVIVLIFVLPYLFG